MSFAQDDVQTPSIFSQEEIAAVQMASHYFGAEAKRAAVEFTTGLNDENGFVLRALAARIDGLTDPLKKQAVGEHLRILSQLLPEVEEVSDTPIQVVAPTDSLRKVVKSPDVSREVVETQPIITGVVEGAYDQDEADNTEGNTESAGSNPERTMSKTERAILVEILGEEKATHLYSLDIRHAQRFIKSVADVYESLPIARLSAYAKQRRSLQLKDLFDGMKVRELAEAYGASYASMVQALHKIPSSITKRVKQSELDKLYQASLQPETVPKPDTIDPVVVKTSSDDSNSPERTSPKIAINFNDALELTAQTLKLTTKSEELGLKMVFDSSLRQPVMNETVQEIRESLGLLIDLVQDSNTNYRLDDLEEAVLRTLVGHLDKQLPALSWTSTQGRESGRLKDAHRNMINVVSVGLAKVHYARKEAARQHDRVI